MIFTIITLFPEVFSPIFSVSMAKRAIDSNKLQVKTLNLRDFGIGKHRTVDDKPYGGGVGMILRVDVLDKAIQAARIKGKNERVILLDPAGIPYKQELVEELSTIEHIILICGHYEGYDNRIRTLIDMEISIGDYVLSGGEIPAMVVVDSVMRLLPGVLKKEEAHALESFSKIDDKRLLEYPQYTRPEEYKGEKIPEILLSGDHKKVQEYRTKEAKKITELRRPDLFKE